MKFSCEKAILNEAISRALRAVSTKSTVSALEGILFHATTALNLTGFDLEIAIRTVAEANVIERGAVILNARLIADIVRKLPDNIVTVETDERFVATITCGPSRFTLNGTDPAQYPELPTVLKEKGAVLPQNILKSMINGTIFSVSDNEAKPIITGCRFSIEEKTLTVTALDNYRLAVRREEISREDEGERLLFVVPGKTLREVERFLDENEGSNVNLSLSRRHISFEMGETTLTSRLLEGEFVNYESIIPNESKLTVQANTNELIDSLDRVSLIINEKLKNYVKCDIKSDIMKLSCQTAIGTSYDECSVKLDGEPLCIGFNSRYLLDALRACRDEEVVLSMSTDVSPCVITPLAGDKFLYLILPVRMRKDNEGK